MSDELHPDVERHLQLLDDEMEVELAIAGHERRLLGEPRVLLPPGHGSHDDPPLPPGADAELDRWLDDRFAPRRQRPPRKPLERVCRAAVAGAAAGLALRLLRLL